MVGEALERGYDDAGVEGHREDQECGALVKSWGYHSLINVELARGLAEQCEPTQIKDKALVLQKVTTVKLDQEYCDILYFVLSRMYIESIIVDIII